MSDFDRELRLRWQDLFSEIQPVATDQYTRVAVEREIVPIIFVPGIMGSRLKRTRPGPTEKAKEVGIAWEPEVLIGWSSPWRSAKRAFWLYKHFAFESPASRKGQLIGEAFDPSYLEVIGRTPDGAVDQGDREYATATEDVPGAYERGWPGASHASYGLLLRNLTEMEWSEPIRHCFDLPVHAFGYNWTESNFDSGTKLVAYIRKTIQEYTSAGRICRHAILVTHSMGGLVARAACRQIDGDPAVLGVIHGVQPAAGAPNAYWRMKGGFAEGGISVVLGKNAAEVTPLLGHMPGGLQLLPNKRYRAIYPGGENSLWLRYPDPADGRLVARPQTGDPYREIYLEQRQFYRLCDARLLDPGAMISASNRIQESPWDLYAGHIAEAENYHRLHESYAHSDTVQFYASGLTTQSKIEFKRIEDVWWKSWRRNILHYITPRIPIPLVASEETDANTRNFRARVFENGRLVDESLTEPGDDDTLYLMTMQHADGVGDGTVPDTSGRVLDVGEEERTVEIGEDEEPDDGARGHEPVYRYKVAQHVTAMAIENLCLGIIRRETGGGGAN